MKTGNVLGMIILMIPFILIIRQIGKDGVRNSIDLNMLRKRVELLEQKQVIPAQKIEGVFFNER